MKHLSLLVVISLLLSTISCATTSHNNTSHEDYSTSSCVHAWNSATCIEPKTCYKCSETVGTALGHTTDSGVCSRCGENFSAWEIGEYTDEFNQPTGKKYVLVDAYGTFSNSATTNSTLHAALQIDKDNIGIMMWEYGSRLLKGTFDYEHYNITILDANSTKHYFEGTIYKSHTRIYFDDGDRNTILNLLRNNDNLKVYLKSTKYSISTYLFTINTSGFDSAYNMIQ